MAWSAQGLQFALFTALKPGHPDALQPWIKLFQSSPQNFQGAAPGAPQLQSSASGVVGDFQVSIGAMPGRFDLTVSAQGGPPSGGPPLMPGGAPPMIDDIGGALRVLVLYAKQLLEFQPAQRLAIVANLAEIVPGPEEALARAADLVGGVNIRAGATDFAFQLNLPKVEAATGQALNRVCRWQTQIAQIITMGIGPSGPSAPAIQSTHVVGLTLDINSVPGHVDFEKDKAVAIVDALASEAEQIISGGYAYVTQ